jgi:hypothetical protein
MTFLAPWAMALGAAGALGVVVLHLVARQRPAAYLLPTARFVPDRQALVSRAISRPHDLPLLLLRVMLLLCAGAAFARPVFESRRTTRARIVLLDRSALVADPDEALRRARSLASAEPSLRIDFDSATISAALVAARRAAPSLAAQAESLELILVSPVAASELDAATASVRATWPGAIRIDRLALRVDSTTPVALERAMPLSDVLGPALVHVPVAAASSHAVRIRRHRAYDSSDSAFADAGGTVVLWDTSSAVPRVRGLTAGADVLVAPLNATTVPAGSRVVARWADGTPAASEHTLGAGCIRTVGVVAPVVGDLALRPDFQRIVRRLTMSCTRPSPAPASAAELSRLAGHGALASGSSFPDGDDRQSPLVPWLLGTALVLALAELALRRRGSGERGTA